MPAAIPRGMLRERMVLQNPVPGRDDAGQAAETWLTVGIVWAHLDAPNTVEQQFEHGTSTVSEYRLLLSWHPALTVRSRLVWVDRGVERIFNLKACFDRDGRRRNCEAIAVEVVP